MLSVIIPAAWGYEPFCRFLNNVVELPIVGEVILINNNVNATPNHKVLEHSKLIHLKMDQNIFVNPAWNLGANLAKYDKLCFLSDDVIVDLRVFLEGDRFINEKVGALGIGISDNIYQFHRGNFQNLDVSKLLVTGDLKIIKHLDEESEEFGCGSLFFIHKKNWIEIPETLKIYWGDNWQFELQIFHNRENYVINNCFYYSPHHSATSTGIADEYRESEEYMKHEKTRTHIDKLQNEYVKNYKRKSYDN